MTKYFVEIIYTYLKFMNDRILLLFTIIIQGLYFFVHPTMFYDIWLFNRYSFI